MILKPSEERIILDLCGGTGAWSEPYLNAGYDVRIVTLPKQDVRDFAKKFERKPFQVYGVLAAPPCDHFSVSGARYFQEKDADGRTEEAVTIVNACMRVIYACGSLRFWALENPVGRLRRLCPEVGPVRLQFDPCDYGDPYTKRTQLFGDFRLPVKVPVEPVRVCSQGSWIQRLGGKSDRTKELRSRTPHGFATAFFKANQ